MSTPGIPQHIVNSRLPLPLAFLVLCMSLALPSLVSLFVYVISSFFQVTQPVPVYGFLGMIRDACVQYGIEFLKWLNGSYPAFYEQYAPVLLVLTGTVCFRVDRTQRVARGWYVVFLCIILALGCTAWTMQLKYDPENQWLTRQYPGGSSALASVRALNLTVLKTSLSALAVLLGLRLPASS